MARPTRGKVAYRIPYDLPCGCRLKNNIGQRICTNAITLQDRTLVCRHGRRWGFRVEVQEFHDVGYYALKSESKL